MDHALVTLRIADKLLHGSRAIHPRWAAGILYLAGQGLDFFQHLVVLRETAHLMFIPDLRPVDVHVEHATTAFDQFGVNVELFSYRIRQTGGLGLVVSFDAVFDADVHYDTSLADVCRHTGWCYVLGKIHRHEEFRIRPNLLKLGAQQLDRLDHIHVGQHAAQAIDQLEFFGVQK